MKKYFSKVVSLALCISMILGSMSMTAFGSFDYDATVDDYYNVISKADYEIAPGITESEIVLNNDDGSRRQVLHFMEADISNPYTKVISSYSEMNTQKYQVSNMMDQATWIEENWGLNVVGAMNTCLSWYNGADYAANPDRVNEPLGFMMVDGVIMNDQAVGFPTVLVIHYDEKDGEARPADIPKVEMRTVKTEADLNGWEEQVIPCSSGFILKDGVIQKAETHSGDDAPRSVVGIKADGTVVIMMNDGRQSPYSAGMTMYEIAAAMKSAGCIHAVNCDGGGSSTFLSQRPGEELAVNCSPSEGALRSTTQGIVFISTAPSTGEFVRAQITSDDVYYTPNSEVQFTAIGTDLVGTAADIPEEAVWQLSDDSFGTIDENGLFTSNGKVGTVAAQLVYNEEVVGEASVTIVVPEISFKQETLVLPYGETATLSINVTTNDGLNTVTTKEGDIVYTLSDPNMGTIVGNAFTTCAADSGVVGGTITATICGDTARSVTATVKFGKASEIIFDFENDYELIIDDSNTGKDPDTGEFYYGWHANDIQSDQYHCYRWTTYKARSPIGIGTKEKLYLVDETTGKVRNGDTALAVNLDWTWVTSMGSKQINVWFPESIDVSEATNFGLWVYFPDLDTIKNPGTFRLQGIKANGSGSSQDIKFTDLLANPGFSDNGWYYVNYDVILNGWASIEYFQIMFTDAAASYINTMADYTFYIDDVTVDYSDATIDRDNPYFTSMSIANAQDSSDEITDNTVITDNTITLYAQAYENTTKDNYTGLDTSSVKVTVDGVEVTSGIAMNASGKISVADLYLNDGIHTIRFEISDEQGNVGSVSRKLTVNTEQSSVRLELADPDAALIPAGAIMYLNLVADDINAVKSVTTRVNLDGVNEWELEGMEVPYGFEASYTVDANNDAIITINRTSEDIDASSNVLAKLPVRIWMTKSYLDPEYIALGMVKDDPALQDKYYALTPYAMWLSDGVSKIHVIADASEGVVTYIDDTQESFSSKKFEVTTELNRYRNSANNGDANFYQNKASFHIHTAGEATDKAATCTEAGYTGRVFCVGCSCKTVELYKHECDTHSGCGSVITWGTTVPATGHDWQFNEENVLACANNPEELYNGIYEGKTYIDGVVIADGWFEVDGIKTYYYKDGAKLTGSNLIDGVMYTFDEDGTYLPNYLFEGFYEVDDTVMYFVGNNHLTGSQKISGVFYNFDDNGLAYDGEVVINGTSCLFDNGVSVATDDVMLAGICGEDAYFVMYTDGRMVICGSGAMTEYNNVGINPWYETIRRSIQIVEIGKDITTIGKRAFQNSPKLHTVIFEEGSKLESISVHGFSQCPLLLSINLPEGIKKISDSAFYQSGLKYIYMPESLTDIGGYAFGEIKENVTLNVLEGTRAHSYAVYHKMDYTLRLGVIASGTCGDNLTWELYSNGELYINGTGAMSDYTYHKYGETAAPWTLYRSDIVKIIIGNEVETIGDYAFYNCTELTEVAFADDGMLTTIGEGAFGYCTSLKSVTLPASLKTLENCAFYYCSGLETVAFAEDSALTTIGNYVFRNDTALKSVYIPETVTKIGASILHACAEDTTLLVAEDTYSYDYAVAKGYKVEVRAHAPIVIYDGTCGESVTWALYDNGDLVIGGTGAMSDYTYHKYGETAAPWTLYRSSIKKVIIEEGVEAIGDYAFYNCTAMTAVEFAADGSLATIGEGAFGYCTSLKSVTLPASLKTLENCAFYYCSGLETVEFAEGNELTTIGDYAFRNDTALKSVYVPETVTKIGASILYACATDTTLLVAADTYSYNYAVSKGYKVEVRAHSPIVIYDGTCGENVTWALYDNGDLVIGGTGAMSDYTYHKYGETAAPWTLYRSSIKKVIIEEGVEAIGDYAFYNCTAMTAVEFAADGSLATIGEGAFGYCTSLKSVTLPASLKTLESCAFYFCSGLETVDYAEGCNLTTIGDYAFRNDTALKSVYIPATVIKIGASILHECGNQVVIYASDSSYAYTYAKGKGYNVTAK